MKTWIKSLFVLAVAGAAAWWWLRPADAATAGPRYRITTVSRGDIVRTVTATGTLEAVTTVQVGSQVSGNIIALHADFNDPVKADQLIAEIDPASYAARVVQAEADLASAQATLDLRQVSFTRAEELLERKLVAQSDFDAAQAELRQQEAAVRMKKAALESAQLDLEHTKIYSPIDGVVIDRQIDVGQTVQASFSAPELFSIAQDLRAMQISASVSEADIGGVETGQAVTFTVDAFPERTFTAKVKQVRKNPTTSANVVTYTTIIEVDNPDLKLLPGMTANVVITIARRDAVLRVATAALRFTPPLAAAVRAPAGEDARVAGAPGEAPRAPGKVVHVLATPPGADGRGQGELIPVPVRVGLSDSMFTEVLSGLDEGAVAVTGTILSGTTVASAAASTTASSSEQTRNPFAPQPPPGGGRR